MSRLLATTLALGAACGSSGGSPDGGACRFPAQPFLTLPTASGRLQVALRSCPAQPPAQGVDTIQYTVTDDAGAPVDGLTLSVAPWMPAMAHGANAPEVTAVGDGGYVASDIYFYMAGSWQLQTHLSGPQGSEADSVTPTIQIP